MQPSKTALKKVMKQVQVMKCENMIIICKLLGIYVREYIDQYQTEAVRGTFTEK